MTHVPRGRVACTVLCAAWAAGCSLLYSPPLELPEARDVRELIVSGNRGGDHEISRIRDSDTIGTVVGQLRAHNSGYAVPFGTFPGPEYTIVVRTDGGDRLVVWIGPDWLGGRELQPVLTEKRLRTLGSQERSDLLAGLALAPR